MPRTIVITTIALLVGAAAAHADPVAFSVTGAKPPVPAMKYHLLPDLEEQTAGNAAPVYLNGALLLRGLTEEELEQVDKWNAGSIDQVPKDDARKLLEKYIGAITQFDIAARRDSCAWDNTIREQGFMALLPHLAELRKGARLLSLRAKLQISEKRWDDAAYTIATGLGMCQHLQQNALLIESLVGNAVGSLMLARTRDWSATPDSPNLYWALTNLPRPMASIAQLLRREQSSVFVTLPTLREARARRISADQWQDVIKQLAGVIDTPTAKNDLAVPVFTAALLPKAKAWMVAQGKTQKEVDAISPVEVVGQWCVADFTEQTDEVNKWLGLPYWQGIEGLRRSTEMFGKEGGAVQNPLFVVVPAATRAYTSLTKFDREVAALQTVEAIRAYFTKNSSLPKSLDELTDTPSLIDPMTGNVFGYGVEGSKFVIESVQKEDKDSLRWEVNVK